MSTLVTSDIYDLLKTIVNEDMKNFTVSDFNKNKKGEGFLGEMSFVSLHDNDSKKVLNLAIKQAFTNEDLRKILNTDTAFQNEIAFYTKIWPRLKEFQESASPMTNFDKIPKCFSTISEKYSEKLVFENIKYQGFEAFEKTKFFDNEHVEMICNVYGKFHAISFAYKKINPQGYLELSNMLLDMNKLISESQGFKERINDTHKECLKLFSPGKDDQIIDKYKKYAEIGADKFFNTHTYKGKYFAILHGDCWSNNLMFKYDESRNLTDMRLLDFQLSKSGTPVSDLSYCLYAGAPKEILDNLDHYLKIYHNSLSETLKQFGCNSEEIYSFDSLKGDWKEYCIYGFTMALTLVKLKLTSHEEIIDYSTFEGDFEKLRKQWKESKYDEDTYNKIIKDLVIHLYENDYL